MSLNDIVNVQISRETQAVSRAGFGTICIVGPNATFSGRLQYYTDLASLAADLTGGESDPEYLAASAIMAQSPRVTRFAVGRIDVGDADLTASLNAINTEQDDWYGLVITSRVLADQEEAADWAETANKIAGFGSADTNIVDQADGVDVTTIAYYLKSNALARSFAFYSSSAASAYPEAALLGKILPYDPGTYTAMFKTLAGITVDDLTPTQSTNVRAKWCNVYEEIGGVNIVREGKVGANEYIDIIIFVDWLDARITESVYAVLVRLPKVPYTSKGIAAIKSAIDQVLKIGQNRDGISEKAFDTDGNQIGGYYITVPAIQDIPTADKTARLLQDVEFVAFLSGAIHAVVINGVVTL